MIDLNYRDAVYSNLPFIVEIYNSTILGKRIS